MDWDDEAIGRLRDLWTEGHSTAEIGRRLSISKNAVVGKAHRLDLAARPSPIRRGGTPSEARPPSPRRVIGPTLPSMAAPAAAPEVAAPVVASKPSPQPRPAEPRVAVVRPSPIRAVTPRPVRTVACCWPLGEPGTPSFRFCDADAAAGKPYCAAHAAVAYVKVRDRREEAA